MIYNVYVTSFYTVLMETLKVSRADTGCSSLFEKCRQSLVEVIHTRITVRMKGSEE